MFYWLMDVFVLGEQCSSAIIYLEMISVFTDIIAQWRLNGQFWKLKMLQSASFIKRPCSNIYCILSCCHLHFWQVYMAQSNTLCHSWNPSSWLSRQPNLADKYITLYTGVLWAKERNLENLSARCLRSRLSFCFLPVAGIKSLGVAKARSMWPFMSI